MNDTRFSFTVDGAPYQPGCAFPVTVSLPAGVKERLAVMVMHDGLNETQADVMHTLAAEGKAPFCACIGIASAPDPFRKNRRSFHYDQFTRWYPDFVAETLLPAVCRNCGVTLTDSADLRMTIGGSSGGISAFNIAWQRPDMFHRVYMTSPSFLAMDNGNSIPVLIRKCEGLPIKVVTEYSENEPDDYFGSSFCAAMEAERSLKYAGYEVLARYYPGEGHCSRNSERQALTEGLTWLWDGWDAGPVSKAGGPPRLADIIADDIWEPADRIPFRKKRMNWTTDESTVLSSDGKYIYSSSPNGNCIYASDINDAMNMGDQPDDRRIHALLHVMPEADGLPCRTPLAIDETDRIFAATPLGIQCVRSYGIVDAILPLPDRQPTTGVEFDGDWLYVRTSGACYRRRMVHAGAGDVPSAPAHISYYD